MHSAHIVTVWFAYLMVWNLDFLKKWNPVLFSIKLNYKCLDTIKLHNHIKNFQFENEIITISENRSNKDERFPKNYDQRTSLKNVQSNLKFSIKFKKKFN